MQPIEEPDQPDQPDKWMMRVLTDAHFWVPLAVLIGGLLLLESIR
jgi:hypothetical protein